MVSVIVPVYNVEKYLDECLSSLEKQTLKDIEIIIVNDGSTDGSKQICLMYATKEHFHYYEKDNGGLMSAYLYGIEKSKGDYIGFVDSDDFVSPEMFEKMYKTALLHNSDIVMCGRKRVYKNRVVEIHDENAANYEGENIDIIHNRALPSLINNDISPARWNKLFKRQVFMENIKYCSERSKIMEDRFIVPACIFSSKVFTIIDDPLYFYRVRSNSNSKGQSTTILKVINKIYLTQKKMLQDKGLYKKYKKNLDDALLNYWKIAIERNVIVSKGAQGYPTCKELLNKDNREFIKAHKQSCKGKFGRCLYFSAKTNLKFVLYFFAKLSKRKFVNEKECFK